MRLTLLFVFVHFLAVSLLVATAAFFFVGRLLGPGIAGLPGRRRQQGLFTQAGDAEQLEFGYCFDVSIPNCIFELSDEKLTASGCHSCLLSCVGMAVRHAIRFVAIDCQG